MFPKDLSLPIIFVLDFLFFLPPKSVIGFTLNDIESCLNTNYIILGTCSHFWFYVEKLILGPQF